MASATFDTNVFPADELREKARMLGVEVVVISVSRREAEGSSVSEEIEALEAVLETAVFGESRWDEAVFGGDKDDGVLERALSILSSGSFPPPGSRQSLSNGQRHQLRDAMILATHVREKRDILVTNDQKGFINHGRKKQIEEAFDTTIMTEEEFKQYLTSLKEAKD